MRAGCRLLIVFLLAALPGCRSRDLVENELRARDIQLREALDELKTLEYHNESLQREVVDLRRPDKKISPEQAAQVYTLQRIVLGRLTGGYDNDKKAGDEGLQVVVEPRDAADHLLKTPGQLTITVLEIHPQGVKQPLGSWNFAAEELRKHWKSGLLSSGYIIELTWKHWPQFENLRVIAQFMLSDGRIYETDKDVKIRLAPASKAPLETPYPVEESPVPLGPAPDAGPTLIVPTAKWTPPSLTHAVQLGTPTPLDPPTLETILPWQNMPQGLFREE